MNEMPTVDFLFHLRDTAEKCVRPYFRSRSLLVEIKEDGSPATEADTAVEEIIRSEIERTFPLHSIIGEEYGALSNPSSPWRWIIDPIDGTRSFLRGNETWAILIALQYEQETVMSSVSFPALSQQYHAIRGQGAFQGETLLHVSATATLDSAVFSHSGFHGSPDMKPYEQFVSKCWDVRGLGNSFSHTCVARGTADIALSLPFASLWDFAALRLLVTEAGGIFETHVDSPLVKGGALSSNGILHNAASTSLHSYVDTVETAVPPLPAS